MDESESLHEQYERLRAMTADDRGATWDLSDRDRAAITAVLEDAEQLRAMVAQEITSLGEVQAASEAGYLRGLEDAAQQCVASASHWERDARDAARVLAACIRSLSRL